GRSTSFPTHAGRQKAESRWAKPAPLPRGRKCGTRAAPIPHRKSGLKLQERSDMTGKSFCAEKRLFLPFMAGFYANVAQPVGWAAFRLIIGGHLVVAGWPKILAPLAQAGFVESIGL